MNGIVLTVFTMRCVGSKKKLVYKRWIFAKINKNVPVISSAMTRISSTSESGLILKRNKKELKRNDSRWTFRMKNKIKKNKNKLKQNNGCLPVFEIR